MILAVDTSLGSAVALLGRDGSTLAELGERNALGHAEVIGTMLQDALAAAQAEAPDDPLTHVVAGMGPGPFTGLRIGIAAARAFALGRGVPVVPVPSHLAAALSVIREEKPSEPFAILTDARRRESAVTVFEGLDVDGIPHVVVDTVLVPREEVDARLGALRQITATELSAVSLARVGARAVAAGRTLAGAEPLYLRAPDARIPSAPKRVGS
ncbi:tRNA (adenosine(37)-N6)-threonylcarbamoyltransferase complex dimerization subunit type 1 TsaB [Microbacterium resistens]|uniref:tRNA (Adenosine(37)-N6)-threonylcarbamoyltransferase complex dimerization subunit type 1 TsaB n=1 Tax=Microbacterium resistens TaxID=156977 RepID=A0ABY3RUQ8_9MICO|nr:tRNA (adenosine(37)-N6)-threonylcarbamoyltransferase complex dimerization subunit type 1 TsaB [Microbacterium resistens]UGS26456.1 tRNA (adenosine(37)-N6)-threonylcarbamoyltransferase complex dimerization subunit type 1 TsaB [Microbacterium resistens]